MNLTTWLWSLTKIQIGLHNEHDYIHALQKNLVPEKTSETQPKLVTTVVNVILGDFA